MEKGCQREWLKMEMYYILHSTAARGDRDGGLSEAGIGIEKKYLTDTDNSDYQREVGAARVKGGKR